MLWMANDERKLKLKMKKMIYAKLKIVKDLLFDCWPTVNRKNYLKKFHSSIDENLVGFWMRAWISHVLNGLPCSCIYSSLFVCLFFFASLCHLVFLVSFNFSLFLFSCFDFYYESERQLRRRRWQQQKRPASSSTSLLLATTVVVFFVVATIFFLLLFEYRCCCFVSNRNFMFICVSLALHIKHPSIHIYICITHTHSSMSYENPQQQNCELTFQRFVQSESFKRCESTAWVRMRQK